MRYGLDGHEPMTLKEIGVVIHLTRERVRQIETRAMERLRRITHRMGITESSSGAGHLRRKEKEKNVLRLTRGIIWSKQTQPLGKKMHLK